MGITIGEWLDPTRAIGLLAYGTGVVCCGIAWWRAKNQRGNNRLIALLMLIESALLLDMTFNWRWILHGYVGLVARSRHEYAMRREPQIIALCLLAVFLFLGVLATLRWYRREPGIRLAVSGVLLSLVVWCVEVVSLHQVDHVLYHLAGKWMVVSALWVIACSMTSGGMLLVSFRENARA